MPPLTRQDTLPSIHSWWSDSNSALVYGPTINIHAIAKPLMKRMYHRQALALIKKNRGKPLSGTTLEIYTSYFQWDFVWWSTKTAIFDDLADRAESNVDEARAVVDSPDFYYITQMLKSPDIGARISSCRLLESLAIHECTRGAILELGTCAQLVSLLRDGGSGVIEWAGWVLERIACSLDGAQAIVDAGALNHVSTFLESPIPNIRSGICFLMGSLAWHESTRAAVVAALKPIETLVTLLRDEDSRVVDRAAHALSRVARSLDGAQAIVDARALDRVSDLLESPSSNIRNGTCFLVGDLAWHESTRAAVIALKPYKLLVSLLGDADSDVVIWSALYALSRIARSFEGAQAIVNAGALNRFFTLLESPSFYVRKWTCVLVGALASHHETSTIAPASLELKPYKRLASFFGFGYSPTITRASAMFALCAISEWPDGVAELADPDIVQELHDLSHSLAITCLDDELSLEYLHTAMENIARYINGTRIDL